MLGVNVPKRRRTGAQPNAPAEEHAPHADDDPNLVTPPPAKAPRLALLVIPEPGSRENAADDAPLDGSDTRRPHFLADDALAEFAAPPRTPATVTRALASAVGDLHMAVASGDVDEVHRLLVEADAPADKADGGKAPQAGQQPMGGAARRLANAQSSAGYTPLSVAAALTDERRAATLCSLLLWHGSDVALANKADERTALHWGAEAGNVAALRAMLSAADGKLTVPTRDNAGDTALHCASRWGRAECIEALAEHGADPHAVTADTFEDAVAVAGKRRDDGFRNASAMRRARSAARRALYISFPALRLLVLHHADCQEHALSASKEHQESPLRIPSILQKLGRVLQPHEMRMLDAFAPASWSAVARAHTGAYVSALAALNRDVSPSTPLAFTPALHIARKRVERQIAEQTFGQPAADAGATTPVAAAALRSQKSSDTYFTKGSLAAALRASGAAIEATRRVLAGEHRAALCVVRPPGHHAGPNGPTTDDVQGEGSCGFCLLNHVAIAALDALTHSGIGGGGASVGGPGVHAVFGGGGGGGGGGPLLGAGSLVPAGGIHAPARPNMLLFGAVPRDSPSDSWAVSSSMAQVTAATAAMAGTASLGGAVVAPGAVDVGGMPPPPNATAPAEPPPAPRRICRRAAIIDFDIHHGNGTEAICREWTRAQRLRGDTVAASALLFISVHLWHQPLESGDGSPAVLPSSSQAEFYPGTGARDDTKCNIVNVPLAPLWLNVKRGVTTRSAAAAATAADDAGGDAGNGGSDVPETPSADEAPQLPSGRAAFRRAVEDRILPALRAHAPDIIYLSSGFDGMLGDVGNARFGDPGIDLRVSDFEFLTEKVAAAAAACGAAGIVSVLEGGYGNEGGRGGDLQRDGLAAAAAAHAKALV